MPATYEPIATTTLGSATSIVTFSDIPQTYTDLRFIISTKETATGTGTAENLLVRVNTTLPTQSQTKLKGDGSSATSSRLTSQSYGKIEIPFTGGQFNLVTIDFFNYTGSTNKTYLSTASNDLNGSGSVTRVVHLIQTTAAISNRVQFEAGNTSFASGSTFTLYGIKAA